jgi:hypothetical protein
MPTLFSDPNAGTNDVITANNAPNGTNVMVSFEFLYQLLTPNNPGTTDISVTQTESPDPSKAGNLALDFTQTTEFVEQQGTDKAVDDVIFDFLIGPPSAYSAVINPSETFTVTATNNSVPGDAPLTYNFTVNVIANSTNSNTPPVAEPTFDNFTFNSVVGHVVANDADHDTVQITQMTVEDAFTIVSNPTGNIGFKISHNKLLINLGTTFEAGGQELNIGPVGASLPDEYDAGVTPSLYKALSTSDFVTFRVDYTVADGHTAQGAVANPGQTSSPNVLTITFEGGGTPPPLPGTQATELTASAGLQLTSLVDQMEALAIGYLGGPADATTISSWAGQMLSSGLTLSQLAASIATESAVTAEYPFLANPQSATPAQVASFVNSVYENVFERAPTAIELTTAENTLTANLSNSQTVDTFILNLMLGAQGVDQTTVTNQIGAAEGVLAIAQDYQAITGTPLSLSQATTIANGLNATAQTQTETQFINGLLSQVADTTIPVVAVEGSMYGQIGSSAVITSLVTNFLPGQIAYANQVGLDPGVFACLETSLVFAFANESGNTSFANNYGPSNAAMPATHAGDAAFAAAAATAIFGSAQTANTANALLGYVNFLEGFFTTNGIVGVQNPTADQIVIAARAGAWGEGVAIALENNLGSLPGQTTNFLEDAAQGSAIYSMPFSSQPTAAPFQGSATASAATTASHVLLTGVAAPVDHIVM